MSSAAFSPDGTRVVTASSGGVTASSGGAARIWEVATGKEITALKGHNAGVQYAAFSPDGLRVVTASQDGTARIWDATTGNELTVMRQLGHTVAFGNQVLSSAEIEFAEFSPDGSRVVTASGMVRIWDPATGRELEAFPGGNLARFNADGTRLVIRSYRVGQDGFSATAIHIWDVSFATMPTQGLLAEACNRRLRGISHYWSEPAASDLAGEHAPTR